MIQELLENLVDHARYELDMVGLFDEDADYDGMLADSVMDLMKTFAGQGHSGASAGITRDLFHRLSNFETLSSITNNPEEWMHIADERTNGKEIWQSKRNPALFSNDGGKTHYHVDNPKEIIQSEQGVAAA